MTLEPTERSVKRPYRSPRRAAQAEATREAIIGAALQLFTSQGFQATTIRQVAEQAEVSEQTVYNIFTDKIGLLCEAGISFIESGTDPEEEAFLAALEAETDPIERIRMAAKNSRQTWEGSAMELERLTFNNELGDPRIDELRSKALAHKLTGTRAVIEILFPDEIRRDGLDLATIADAAVALDSAATVTILLELGWTLDRWEEWLVQFLALFLEERPG